MYSVVVLLCAVMLFGWCWCIVLCCVELLCLWLCWFVFVVFGVVLMCCVVLCCVVLCCVFGGVSFCSVLRYVWCWCSVL